MSLNQPNNTTLVTQPLFGGAMCIDLPSSYLDSSNFREIPDNQEVWTDNLEVPSQSSQSSSCPSVIIEILGRCEEPNQSVTSFMFDDLATANHVAPNDRSFLFEFDDTTMTKSTNFPNADFAAGGIGQMKVEKNRDLDLVTVFVWVLRLKEIDTDILITLNDPCIQYSNAQEATQSPRFQLFSKIIRSLKVLDWGLFC